MNFQLDNNTIVLIIVVAFLAYYFFSDYKEGFRAQRGISRSSRGISSKAQAPVAPPPVVVAPPPPPPVVVAPPPPPPQVFTGDDADFAGLL
jgi:hypothetical protein